MTLINHDDQCLHRKIESKIEKLDSLHLQIGTIDITDKITKHESKRILKITTNTT